MKVNKILEKEYTGIFLGFLKAFDTQLTQKKIKDEAWLKLVSKGDINGMRGI